MAERLKAHAWRACKRVTVSWVRIPPYPLLTLHVPSHPLHGGRGLVCELVQRATGDVQLFQGQVRERLKRPVSKTGVPARVPWVRIPPCPLELRDSARPPARLFGHRFGHNAQVHFMARTQQPPPPEIKHFRPDEIERGLVQLRRRLTDVEAFVPQRMVEPGGEGEATVLAQDITTTILDVFGPNSPEYRDNQNVHMYGYVMIASGMTDEDIIEGYVVGQKKVVALVKGLIKRLEEKRQDLGGSSSDRVRAAFQGLDLHSRIAEAATELYLNGHYAEAVFSAAKALVNYVKERSGRHDLDGAPLMRTVFSKNDPILAVSDLKDQTDLDEQEGVMHMLEGAVLAIRNPGGHGFPELSPERAVEYVATLSLLANRVKEAKKVK